MRVEEYDFIRDMIKKLVYSIVQDTKPIKSGLIDANSQKESARILRENKSILTSVLKLKNKRLI